jgi:hypothetical protein
MQPEDATLIRVQREWNGWRSAQVRLDHLHDVHWFQPDRAPRQLVHGYVSCASIVDGDIPHECSLTQGPHRLLVCVLKRHTTPGAYAELARRADGHQVSAATALAAEASAEGSDPALTNVS